MKVQRLALLSAALIACGAFTSQDGVLLRRNLQPGTEKYAFEMVSNQTVTPQAGNRPVQISSKVTMDQILEIGNVDAENGRADVQMTITNIKMESEGPMALPRPDNFKDIKATGKLDAQNRLTDAKFAGDVDRAIKMQLGSSPESVATSITFPDKAIKPGETWTMALPKNPALGNQRLEITLRFEGNRDHNGKNVYVVTADQDVPLDIDLGKALEGEADASPLAGMDAHMKGKNRLKMEALVDPANGRVILWTSDSALDVTIDLTSMGQSLTMTGNIVTKMEYKG